MADDFAEVLAIQEKSKRKVYIILFVFSVVLIPLAINYFSIPLVFVMFLTPLYLYREEFNTDDLIPIYLILAILLTGITHPEAFRISTVGYSILFVTTYMYYTKVLQGSSMSPANFQNFCKYIIQAFAVVLAIQIVSRLLGIPSINASYNTEEGLKFNSLAFEASQIGPVITILMYGYIKIEEMVTNAKLDFNQLFDSKHRVAFLPFFLTSILSLSVTCYLSLFVFILYFIPLRKIIIGSIALALFLTLFFLLGTETGDRILALIPVLMTMDVRLIYEADPSASARIVPIIVFFQEFDLFSWEMWFGHGCDYGNLHIWKILIDDENAEDSLAVVGMFGFILDYGLVPFIIFVKLIHTLCKFLSFPFFLYMTCFFLLGFNMSSTWLFFMVIYTLNFFAMQQYENTDFYNNSNIQCIDNVEKMS